MQERMLYEVVEAIVGKNGDAIVDILKDKKDVNEFKIAEKLKLTINQARNILYKLSSQDVVSFIRKKDKAKGWYIYYWTLNITKSLEHLLKLKQKELYDSQNILKSLQTKRFYHCNGCSMNLTEETALNHDFLCPECGTLLEASDNNEKIAEINKKISKVEKEILVIDGEVGKLRQATDKKHAKKDSAMRSKKKKERKEKRQVNQKNKVIEQKKNERKAKKALKKKK
ncbi:MAG: hypothetical protein V1660_01840 [archaeon]